MKLLAKFTIPVIFVMWAHFDTVCSMEKSYSGVPHDIDDEITDEKESLQERKYTSYRFDKKSLAMLHSDPPDYSKMYMCHVCRVVPSENSEQLKLCLGCRRVRYCSKRCQKRDWHFLNHKRDCGYNVSVRVIEDQSQISGRYVFTSFIPDGAKTIEERVLTDKYLEPTWCFGHPKNDKRCSTTPKSVRVPAGVYRISVFVREPHRHKGGNFNVGVHFWTKSERNSFKACGEKTINVPDDENLTKTSDSSVEVTINVEGDYKRCEDLFDGLDGKGTMFHLHDK
eukprot:621773_1